MKIFTRWLMLILSATLIFTSALAVYADTADAEASAEPKSSKTEETSDSPEAGNLEEEAGQEDEVQSEEVLQEPQEQQDDEVQITEQQDVQDAQDAGMLRAASGSGDRGTDSSDNKDLQTDETPGDALTESATVKENLEPETYTVTWLDYNGNNIEVDESV